MRHPLLFGALPYAKSSVIIPVGVLPKEEHLRSRESPNLELRVCATRPVVICMVLALNTEEGDTGNDATVTFDLGNIGPEARPFDSKWEPR